MERANTRLAPTPTGSLHLGNAATFLVAWWWARRSRGRVLLRIDDIDRTRVRPELVERQIEDLRWLGLDWDEGPVFESDRLALYARARDRLAERGRLYPCVCTRREVRAAALAPHPEDEEFTYPGTCRGRFADRTRAERDSGRPAALRFAVPPGEIRFEDRRLGPMAIDPARRGGDFVVWTKDGGPSYQLACAVDDGTDPVDLVVRGADLVASTPRQLLLQRALGLPSPAYAHTPLLVDPSGRRLAKRDGDTCLADLRRAGVDPADVVAHLARLLGQEAGDRARPADVAGRFRPERLPAGPIALGRLPWSEKRGGRS